MSHATRTAQTAGRVNQQAFTLIEMSIVLSIIAVIIAGTISMGDSMISSAQLASTNSKLDAIETALMAYRVANNRLPCPADPTVIEGGTNYGYEAGTAGTCTASNISSYTIPKSSTDYAALGITAVEGALPVKTLNLPDEYQVDGWGKKVAYGVAVPMTGSNAFVNYGLYANCGALSVENAGGSYRTQVADYVLLSYGPNGHGGYLKSGMRFFMGSDNAAEQTNCHCNTSADTGYAATYVQQDPTQTSSADSLSVFDDIVRYKERWQMQNAYDTYNPGSQLPCASASTSTGNGFVIDGQNAGDLAGSSVAVGDVNGDGIPDIIIGAPHANSQAGKVYVVFGTRTGFPDPLPLSSLNGTNGFELDGAAANDDVGTSVATGDVNGDGVADVIIGGPGASPHGSASGSVYVVFGGSTREDGSPWSTCPCTLSAGASNFLNGTNGAEFDGTGTDDVLGFSVATGDVNGDGIADLIMSAPFAPPLNQANGAVYVVFGHAGTWPSTATTLTSGSNPLDGTHGAEFDGATAAIKLGSSVATGDVNGDGIADLIMGAPTAPVGVGNGGAVYVVFGHTGTWSSTATTLTSGSKPLDGTHGAEFDGAGNNNDLGTSVATGDVNGDGIADLIMAAGGFGSGGAVYVVFGHTGAWKSATTLTSGTNPLDGTHGAAFYGVGSFLATGDVNGDGIPDLLMREASVVYVVFGQTGAWSSTATTLTADSGTNPLDGTHGAEFDGATPADGYASLATGDVNGDGIADLVIGADGVTVGSNSDAGAVYVYFGRKSGWPSTAFNLGGL